MSKRHMNNATKAAEMHMSSGAGGQCRAKEIQRSTVCSSKQPIVNPPAINIPGDQNDGNGLCYSRSLTACFTTSCAGSLETLTISHHRPPCSGAPLHCVSCVHNATGHVLVQRYAFEARDNHPDGRPLVHFQ